jgi:hypothetical protein
LPLVTDQKHTVAGLQPMQELVHLFRARETRFVQDIKPLLSTAGLLTSGQMTLQGARVDA